MIVQDRALFWSELSSMKDKSDFLDLELICPSVSEKEAQKSISCHKLILSQVSRFMMEILKEQEETHEVVIIFPETSISDLQHLVDSIYDNLRNNESSQEQSDIFLHTDLAERLGMTRRFEEIKPELNVQIKLEKEDKEEESDENLIGEEEFEPQCGEVDFQRHNPMRRARKQQLFARHFLDEPRTVKKEPKIDTETKEKVKEMVATLVKPKQIRHPWDCSECDKRFPTSRQLRSHRHHVHIRDQNTFVCCKMCKKKISVRRFKLHFRNWHQTRVCDHCGKTFANISNLCKHRSFFHKNVECAICNHVCEGKQDYLNHMASKHGAFFTCEKCGKTFGKTHNLKSHLRKVHVENDQKKYKCSHCDKNFTDRLKLKSHVSSAHTGEKPFKCRYPGCETRCSDHCNIFKHERIKHGAIYTKHLENAKTKIV